MFPFPSSTAAAPIWTGRGFLVDGQPAPFLSYLSESSGWSDDLTGFHEQIAGQHHPIDVASRRNAVGQLVRRLPPGATLLEVGCSSGFLLEDLRAAMPGATLIGSDFVAGPLAALAQRMPDVPLLQFNLVTCPLEDACVDAVVMLNVLEHIEEDFAALKQTCRILKPGGLVVIEVPAGPQLYDDYDRYLMHHRRYTMAELRAKVAEAGLESLEASHLGFFVYPAFVRAKRKNQRNMAGDAAAMQRVTEREIQQTRGSRLLKLLLDIEAGLGRWVSYPTGIRCTMVCRKPL